jgi:hypothetical protein
MKKIYVICFLSFILLSGCASPPKRTINESMLSFLPYLNQKVAGYISMNNVKSLDANSYKEIVNSVCSPLPSCQKSSELMFIKYTVQARMITDRLFSVMLCNTGPEDKYKEADERVTALNEITEKLIMQKLKEWCGDIDSFLPQLTDIGGQAQKAIDNVKKSIEVAKSITEAFAALDKVIELAGSITVS